MTQITMMAGIVGFIVVILVATAFITLAIFYFNAQAFFIGSGNLDYDIQCELIARISALRRRFGSMARARLALLRGERRLSLLRRVAWFFYLCFFLLVLLFLLFSRVVGGERHAWLGDTAMLTVATDSMASAHVKNDYLFDENGVASGEDRIPQYTFLTVSRRKEDIDAMRVGDIAAFTMLSETGEEITVIHRLIRLSAGEDGAPRYTFRGDANPSSMKGEFEIGREAIVGVFTSATYQGAESLFLGCLVTYLRSATGIAMTAIAILMMIIYLSLSDRMDKAYLKRYKTLEELFFRNAD